VSWVDRQSNIPSKVQKINKSSVYNMDRSQIMSAPQYSIGQTINYFDYYLIKNVVGVVIDKERPRGQHLHS